MLTEDYSDYLRISRGVLLYLRNNISGKYRCVRHKISAFIIVLKQKHRDVTSIAIVSQTENAFITFFKSARFHFFPFFFTNSVLKSVKKVLIRKT